MNKATWNVKRSLFTEDGNLQLLSSTSISFSFIVGLINLKLCVRVTVSSGIFCIISNILLNYYIKLKIVIWSTLFIGIGLEMHVCLYVRRRESAIQKKKQANYFRSYISFQWIVIKIQDLLGASEMRPQNLFWSGFFTADKRVNCPE